MSRNWSSLSTGSRNIKRSQYPGNIVTQDTTSSGYADHYKDVNRPDVIRTSKSRGWRPPTPWNVLDKEYDQWYGVAAYETRNTTDPTGKFELVRFSGLISGLLGGATPSPLPSYSLPGLNEQNRVETEALLRVRNQKIQTSTVIAESNKTTRMIADRLERIADAYRLARKGNFYGAQRVLGATRKDSARSWLELSYGWLPLLGDIEGAYEAVRQRTIKDRMIVKGQSQYQTGGDSWGRYDPLNYPWTCYYKDTVEQFTKCVLYYEYTNTSLARASQVGLTNPLETAWELVPFSFVVDWLLPVSNWLGAQTAAHGTSFRGGSLTRWVVASRSGFARPRAPIVSGNIKTSCQTVSATCRGRIKEMVRTTYSTSPDPRIYVKNPFTNTRRALNALALLKVVTQK